MEIRFDCTMCGKCCHNLKLPLSIGEAASWLIRGGRVEVIAEAIPWVDEPEADDRKGRYAQDRSFAASCGGLPIRTSVTLVAAFDGACPFLLPDMRCGGYEERPAVCRIYPVEVNPFLEMDPAAKACPPEAWGQDLPPIYRDGAIASHEMQQLVAAVHRRAVDEVDGRQRLCGLLGLDVAALKNEGFALHRPAPSALASAIASLEQPEVPADETRWRIMSNRRDTLDVLGDAGLPAAQESADFRYLGFFPDS